MQFIRTKIHDIILIEPKVFGDERGFFMDSFDEGKLNQFLGHNVRLWRECHSKSAIGVLRGLHIQTKLAKLVRCLHGRLFDVAVDARPDSPTRGQWVGYELSAENKRQLYIPHGFLHGFYTLTDGAELCYKVDDEYKPQSESAVLYNDTDINIAWPLAGQPILSEKDKNAITFTEYLNKTQHDQ